MDDFPSAMNGGYHLQLPERKFGHGRIFAELM
jgi:hypothetical protein